MQRDYDIVVLGSGIAGSVLGLVLQQAGLKTLVVERKSHPRFVIGESTIPTTSLLFNYLASTYRVPELAEVAHYLGLRERGCAAWPKQIFWYGVHHPAKPLDPKEEVMFEAGMLPIGPDVHMLRADADGFLASRLTSYGVDYHEHTEMLDFSCEPHGVRLRLRGPAGEQSVTASFVVDCTGHASFLAKRFGLRDADARLRTNTRSIFGHFKNVPALDTALGGAHPQFRFLRNAGTMHHCFKDGWVWVIPFDNGVTSVGVQMDRRTYPLDESIPAEQELRRFIEQYPSMLDHFGQMEPVRPIIRADRIQFTSSSIVGNGFILAPHAAGFIEPLFSTGIVLTLSFIARFVPSALEAKRQDDWNPERFWPIERHFFEEVRQIDRLVDGMIHSFRSFDVFKQYWRNWIVGTLTQYSMCIMSGLGATRDHAMLYGSGLPGFVDDVEAMYQMVVHPTEDDALLAAELKKRVDVWFDLICRPPLSTRGDFAVNSREGTAVLGAGGPEDVVAWFKKLEPIYARVSPQLTFATAEKWMQQGPVRLAQQMERYRQSKREGTDYHRAYERILANANPSTFDYATVINLPR